MTWPWRSIIGVLALLMGLLDLWVAAASWLHDGRWLHVVMFCAGLGLIGYAAWLFRRRRIF